MAVHSMAQEGTTAERRGFVWVNYKKRLLHIPRHFFQTMLLADS